MRVPVKNLRQVDPSVSVDLLQEALGLEFLEGDPDIANKRKKMSLDQVKNLFSIYIAKTSHARSLFAVHANGWTNLNSLE